MYCVYVVQMSMSMYLDLHTCVLHNSVYMCTQICVHLLMNIYQYTHHMHTSLYWHYCTCVHFGQESWEGL